MTQRLLTLYRCAGAVCPEVPGDVVLCVPYEKVRPHVCPETEDDAPFEFSYIEGSVVSQCKKGCEWEITISYDDTQIIDNYELKGGDVQGISCKGCLGTYADQRAGNEVYIYEDEEGGQVLVSQHGCEYPLASADTADLEPIFGDGSDGDFTPGAGVQYFPDPFRDYFYQDMTIDAGTTFVPIGDFVGPDFPTRYAIGRIFVNGTLTINGTILMDGDSTDTYYPAGSGRPTTMFGGAIDVGGSGGSGRAQASVAGDGNPPNGDLGQSGAIGVMGGGYGGNGGDGGGSGGQGYEIVELYDGYPVVLKRLYRDLMVQFPIKGYPYAVGGGTGGGGGGGGNATNAASTNGGDGGDGAFGGGVIIIYARNIVIGATGLITAKGEAGHAGSSGSIAGGGFSDGGGGGGGGGGGCIYMVYESLTNNVAVPADAYVVTGGAGGAGGAALGGGAAGVDGSDGADGNVYRLNWTTGLFE